MPKRRHPLESAIHCGSEVGSKETEHQHNQRFGSVKANRRILLHREKCFFLLFWDPQTSLTQSAKPSPRGLFMRNTQVSTSFSVREDLSLTERLRLSLHRKIHPVFLNQPRQSFIVKQIGKKIKIIVFPETSN